MIFSLRKYILVAMFFMACSCRGFYQPVTLNTKVPDGPPAYQSGFRSGCRSALSTRTFANSFVYDVDFGSGVYHQDPAYSTGWGHGWFACVIHQATFTNMTEYWPLE